MTKKNKRNNITIKILNCYYVFTILYFCFGKWNWNIPSYQKLLFYLVICYAALNLGYRRNKNFKSNNRQEATTTKDSRVVYKRLRPVFIVSSILLIIFQIAWVYVFLNKFNISNIFATLGSNYYERLNASFESKVFIMQIRTILWGLTFFAYPIGFLYFKQMSAVDKILLISTIIVDCLASLNMGISKNIGDIVIIAIGMIILKSITLQTQEKKTAKRKNKYISILLIVLLFLPIFGKIQDIRADYKQVAQNPYGKFATINDDTAYYAIFGKNSSISNMIDKIGGYVSNSYTGLAYALELPYENTYLIGSSRALMEYSEQYLHVSIMNKTYNQRLEDVYGWKNGQWWPTAFVWMANSVSFIGVPIILYLLGKFMKKLENEYKDGGNILSAVMYSQLLIMMVYLPCNMQILQSRQALLGIILLIILYLFRNKNCQRKNNKNAENNGE